MFTVFSDFIQSNYSGLFFVFAGFIITWKAAMLYSKFRVIEDDVSIMKVDITSLKNDMALLSHKVDKIANTLDNLLSFLKDRFENFPMDMIKAKSPYELTEAGSALLIEIGGKAYIENNLAILMHEMDQNEFKSPLDVQNKAGIIFYSKTEQNEFTPIKNFIYNNPTITINGTIIDLKLSMVLGMMGIYLRNKYLELHPELTKGLPEYALLSKNIDQSLQ